MPYTPAIKAAAIGIMAGLALLIGLYLARGWIRGPFLSQVTTWTHGRAIDRVYDQDIAPIQKELEAPGMQVKDAHSPRRAECFDSNFSGFRETLFCRRDSYSYRRGIDGAFAQNWQATAHKVDKLLKDGGWTLDKQLSITAGPNNASLSQLIDGTVNTPNLQFTKQSGSIECRYYFGYERAIAHYPSVLNIQTYCTRKVHILGGYTHTLP